jgi:hypothetical protein
MPMAKPAPNAPTRTPATIAAYTRRYQNNVASYQGTPFVDDADLDIGRFADWMIETKRAGLAPSSWRQERNAVREGLTALAARRPEMAAMTATQIQRIDATRAWRPSELAIANEVAYFAANPLRTSAAKAKNLALGDLDRLCARMLSAPSTNAKGLVAFLRASSLAGLRPDEWRRAALTRLAAGPHQWELRVANAKATNGRATGEFRTLRWASLSPLEVSVLTATIRTASDENDRGRYARWLATLRSLLCRVTKALFPRRARRPTLYTGRHAAAARWKRHYIRTDAPLEERQRGAAVVAALLGHASDATASTHYGRAADNSGAFGIPEADEAEVQLVRQRLFPKRDALDEIRSRKRSVDVDEGGRSP